MSVAAGRRKWHDIDVYKRQAWLRSEYLMPKALVYRADNYYAIALENSSLKEELTHD